MSPTKTTTGRRRMKGDDRRDAVLEAALRAFARGGYAGTSTDAIAKEAGVSQPYVVRIFGTKLALFLEVFEVACGRIQATFEDVIERGFDPEDDEDWAALGLAYTDLMRDRDLLMVMMHGFAASNDDQVAARSRESMGRIFAALLGTGCEPERAQEFVAQGMLLNVMVSMRAPEHLEENPDLALLAQCAFGDALPFVVPSGR